jgi:hypothetical protein
VIDPQPQPGDIGLTQIPGFVGWLIRVGQWLNGDSWGDYQHAFIVLPDDELIEAYPRGARIRPLAEYDGQRTVYVHPDGLTDGQRQAICAAAVKYRGVRYSVADYLALAAHRFRLPIPGLRKYVASSRRMICSQLADAAYTDAGVSLFRDGRWAGWVTPMAIFNLLGRDGVQR